jgi:hypothetical protein
MRGEGGAGLLRRQHGAGRPIRISNPAPVGKIRMFRGTGGKTDKDITRLAKARVEMAVCLNYWRHST